MKQLCEAIQSSASEILAEWQDLVRKQPWYSLPAESRTGRLGEVLVALAEASLGTPDKVATHRGKIVAAAVHGHTRREQGIPEHLILTEYHLLRQALWRFLLRRYPTSPDVAEAIMRVDVAITAATNASMWGYYRTEIEALGKWEEGMERLVRESPRPDRVSSPASVGVLP